MTPNKSEVFLFNFNPILLPPSFKYFLLFLLVRLFTLSACQTDDSQSISNRINPILQRAHFFISSNPDSAILLTDYVIRITEQSSTSDSLYIAAQFIKAQAIHQKGFYDNANSYLHELIRYVDATKDTATLAQLNYHLGFWYYKVNNYVLAKEYLEKANLYYQTIDNRSMQMDAIFYTAISDLCLGNFDVSERGMMRALKYYQKTQDAFKLGLGYLNVGNLMNELNRNDDALQYYLKSVDEFERIDDSISLANVYVNMGILQKTKGNLDSALYYYQISENYNINQSDNVAKIINRFNMVNVYIRQKKFDIALTNLDWCLAECITNNVPGGISRIYASYSDIYSEKKMFNKSLEYLDMAINLSDSLHNRPVKLQLLAAKVALLNKMEKNNNAEAISQQLRLLSDSLNKDAVSAKLSADTTKLSDNNNAKKYVYVQKKSTNSFDYFKLIMLILLSLVLMAVFYFYTKRTNTQ